MSHETRTRAAVLTFGDLWELLNALDETVEIEAKHGSQMGDSALETVSAYCNEPGGGGGYLLFGVRQRPGSEVPGYEVVGVPDPNKLQNDLVSRCNSEFNHPVRPQVVVEQHGGATVVIAHVPEAPAQHKPIYLKKRGVHQGAYRRIGSADVLCSDEDVAYFYQAQTHRTYDETPVEEATLQDLDPDMLREYRRLRAEANPNAAELSMSDEELLYALNAASRSGGRLVPTTGGILLFGSRAAIRRHFPSMRIDYVRVPGREWVPDPNNRYEAVEILDPLLRAVPRAITSVMDDLPKAFHLAPGEDRRRDIPLLPYEVVREVIVNAVMHRNYRMHGPILIIRYANRIEVRNPGMSLVPDDRLGEPGSITRNEKVAAILHETQYAEAKGTGIRAVRELMKRYDLAPPFFESDRERDTFTAYLLFHHLLVPEDLEWLDGFRSLGLSDEERRALVYVREMGAINNALYRTINGVETLVASRHLLRLRDAGLLETKGQGRATYYLPSARFIASLVTTGGPESSKLPSESSNLGAESTNLVGLPADLQAELAALGRYASRADLVRLVVRVCEVRAWHASELASLLSRSRAYVHHQYLRPLVEQGKLALGFPDQPNHPQQTYRTIGATANE